MNPEDELIIDPEANTDDLAEHPTKTLVFVSTFDPSTRIEVVPTANQTVRDAAEVSGLTARDGSSWTVYDALGVEVGHLPSFDLIGDVLYVGPQAVSAGSDEIHRPNRELVKALSRIEEALLKLNYLIEEIRRDD